MSGSLGLATSWAREDLPDPLRSELRALVPDGWTVGLSVSTGRTRYRAWANDDQTGRYALWMTERRTPEAAIRDVIAWIKRQDEGWRVSVRSSYLRCAQCGHRLGAYGECDSCTADEEAERSWTVTDA